MSNAPLALRADAPTVFGSRDELQAIADRIRVMLPSAHLSDWQLRQDNRNDLQKALNESIYRAAQLCVFYRLVPGEDVHVIPFGNNWAVDMGIETWKKAADRYCSLHGITYHIHTEEMPVEELKARRGTDYHPDDVGMVAYLWRSDKKDVYEIFGAKQSMSRACGVWAKKARYNKGKNEWQEDNIPTQRSKQDVAKRRAMKAALKLEFSLDSLLAATPDAVSRNIEGLRMSIDAVERNAAIIQRPREEIDEDGFIVVEPTRRNVEFVVAGQGNEIEPDIDEQEVPSVDDDVDFEQLRARLTGREASFVTWTKSAHLNSTSPASPPQYRYLVGVLNAIVGDSDAHRKLLGIFCGRHVSGDNPPGAQLAGKLLEWLVEETKDEVTGEKMPNPRYREDYVECVKAIHAA